jgi:hypothetical protein
MEDPRLPSPDLAGGEEETDCDPVESAEAAPSALGAVEERLRSTITVPREYWLSQVVAAEASSQTPHAEFSTRADAVLSPPPVWAILEERESLREVAGVGTRPEGIPVLRVARRRLECGGSRRQLELGARVGAAASLAAQAVAVAVAGTAVAVAVAAITGPVLVVGRVAASSAATTP